MKPIVEWRNGRRIRVCDPKDRPILANRNESVRGFWPSRVTLTQVGNASSIVGIAQDES